MRRPTTGRAKRVSLVIGAAAVLSLGALSMQLDEGSLGTELAKGSGASVTGTEYVQPSVGAAQLGATAVAVSTPSSVPATPKAAPPLKAT